MEDKKKDVVKDPNLDITIMNREQKEQIESFQRIHDRLFAIKDKDVSCDEITNILEGCHTMTNKQVIKIIDMLLFTDYLIFVSAVISQNVKFIIDIKDILIILDKISDNKKSVLDAKRHLLLIYLGENTRNSRVQNVTYPDVKKLLLLFKEDKSISRDDNNDNENHRRQIIFGYCKLISQRLNSNQLQDLVELTTRNDEDDKILKYLQQLEYKKKNQVDIR